MAAVAASLTSMSSVTNCRLKLLHFGVGITIAFAIAVISEPMLARPFTPVRGGHGCVNAGTDPRVDPYGLICGLQRRYSYATPLQPRLHRHVTWAWTLRPAYFVYNRKLSDGNWLLVRAGWRYDRSWGGYIGPSFAWKKIPAPLLYY